MEGSVEYKGCLCACCEKVERNCTGKKRMQREKIGWIITQNADITSQKSTHSVFRGIRGFDALESWLKFFLSCFGAVLWSHDRFLWVVFPVILIIHCNHAIDPSCSHAYSVGRSHNIRHRRSLLFLLVCKEGQREARVRWNMVGRKRLFSTLSLHGLTDTWIISTEEVIFIYILSCIRYHVIYWRDLMCVVMQIMEKNFSAWRR